MFTPYLWPYYLFMAVCGLCIGSFLNVLIYRLPREESIIKGRSHCTSCGRVLTPLELVPMFSWLFLGGRCHGCKAKISPRYPIVELMGGLVFTAAAVIYDFTWLAPVMGLFFCALIAIAFIDADTQFIPDALVIAIAILAVISYFAPPGLTGIVSRLIGAACVSLPIFIIGKLTNGFGMGDAKLMAAAGLLMGWQLTLVAFLIGVVTGGIGGAVLLIAKKARRGTAMAFGPYLCFGLFTACCVGQPIIDFYVGLF